jgi:hypothetical protein
MFDRDFREGSSIDELIMSQLRAAHAAHLLGREEQEYWNVEIWRWCFTELHSRQETLRAIARELYDRHNLDGARLREILEGEASA